MREVSKEASIPWLVVRNMGDATFAVFDISHPGVDVTFVALAEGFASHAEARAHMIDVLLACDALAYDGVKH